MNDRTGGVLITGGTSDIGRAAATAFAHAGYAVALGHRRAGDGEASALADALVREHGAPRAIAVQADVRERDAVRRLVETAFDALGRVTVLVNAAGCNRDQPFLQMTDDAWEEVRATILDGTFHCCQTFARRLGEDDGCIVNVGAVTAVKGRRNGANYCAARAGVVALTKCLALELGPRIRVNAVTPGFIATGETRRRYRLDEPEQRRSWEASIPLGRLGTPDDVAAMIVFLAGPGGAYVSGQNHFVDGAYFPR